MNVAERINQNNCKILVHSCVYTSDGSFVTQKLLWEKKGALSYLQRKKLLKTLNVAKTLLSTIYKALEKCQS